MMYYYFYILPRHYIHFFFSFQKVLNFDYSPQKCQAEEACEINKALFSLSSHERKVFLNQFATS